MPLASVKAEDDDRVSVEPSAVAGISAFLGKLWKMVEDPKTDHLISWGKSGNTFVIKNQIDFAKTILPNYYKHNNIASFIRQLNMYGFHKIISTTSGALDSSDNDEIEFTHPCFVRGHPYLLEQIKRKMNNPKENCIKNENGTQFNESIKRVFSDIKNLKGKQEHLGSQLCSVKQENEILWRELSLLRQKHAAQQNVLNKLIRFLVSLAQPSTNHNLVKRRLVPLMLKDAASNSKSSYYEGDHVYTVKKREQSSPGPTIHEIHPSDINENIQIVETHGSDDSNSPIMIEQEIVTSPASSVASSDISIASPEPMPVPAALLMPSKKGKNCIQTMYVSPNQQLKPHFLLSPGTPKNGDSPEYLVPDKTDNPLLELVHEAEPDENDYITIVAGDGAEVGSPVPASLLAETELESVLSSKVNHNKKKTTAPRRRMKRETAAPLPAPKIMGIRKVERKKRSNLSKDNGADNVLSSNEFLFDIDLDNCSEPMIPIRAPNERPNGRCVEENSEVFTLDKLAENRANVPITVEDMMNVSSDLTNSKTPESPVKVLSPNPPTMTIPSPANSPKSGVDAIKEIRSDGLMKQINECIDNAQNMKIACTDNSASLNKMYVDDISGQLDTMQTDIDSIKELIQNEGLSLDTNIFYDMLNQEQMNYGAQQEIHPHFHRPEEGKIGTHELICNQPFDFDDFLSHNDWGQSVNSLNGVDTDYCNLNTPHVERPLDEIQTIFPPPSKKIRSFNV